MADLVGSAEVVMALDDRARVVLEGEFDAANTPPLELVLLGCVAPGRLVEVDMERVSFFASSGVGALLSAHKAASEVGGDVCIVNGSPIVHRTFEVLNLTRMFGLPPIPPDSGAS